MPTDVLRERRRAAYETDRPEVQQLVPRDARRILDLGCAAGGLGAAIKRRQQAEVVGIELDPGYAADANAVLNRVICADADTGLARDDLGRFDCAIAADVLEHLVDPWSTTRRLADLLQPSGTLVVSLPNVQYLKTFKELAKGHWPREDAGLFDRTHLRWFTIKDAHELLTQAGLTVTATAPQYWFSGRVKRVAERLPGLAPFLAGQVVLAGRKP
ncbi:MAG TPA: methyltransferase domain-containing protein [Solirubrobacteraceae bacterium]